MSTAIYQVIFEDLRKKIFSGEVNPGEMLPSESELAKQYNASRVTIRKSLEMLEREKIIRSWHGKGYFVLTPEHERFTLIYDECVDQYESKIQNIQLVEPDEELLHALSLKPRQRAVSIMRRMSDKTHTMILDILYFPYSKGMPLVEAEIKYARLPDLVRSKTSVFSIHTRLEIGAEAVRGEIAKRLELAEGTCVLVTYRYLLNENEQVVAYGKRFLHPAYGRLSAVSGYWAREKAD